MAAPPPAWQLPTQTKSQASSVSSASSHPSSLASLYPQVVPDGVSPGGVSAYASFSQAARKAAAAAQELGGHPQAIPPTVAYPASTLLTGHATGAGAHTGSVGSTSSTPGVGRPTSSPPPPPISPFASSARSTVMQSAAPPSTQAVLPRGPSTGVGIGASRLLSPSPSSGGLGATMGGMPSLMGGLGQALHLHSHNSASHPTHLQKVSLDVGQPLNALTCSPDRTHFAVGGKEVKIIAQEKGKFMQMKNFNTNSKTPTALSDIQWHPLESYKYWLVTAPTNGKILLYNLSKEGLKRAERILEDHERTVNRIVWHPSQGDVLFSGSQDGTVKMFDLRTPSGKSVQSFSDIHSVRDVQVNPFNHNIFASAYENGSMQIWDVRKGQYFHTINAHQGLILTLDWHPEDKDILASGGVDRAIKVWHIGASVEKSMGIHSTPASSHSGSLTHSQSYGGSSLGSAGSLGSSGSSTNQSEPLHTIQTIASVGRVKWRPSNRYHFQIASAANLMDCRIHLWNVHKPFVPMASLLGHKDVISGFFFSDVDSAGGLIGDEIISCSKDSTIQQHFLYVDHTQNPNYHLTAYPNEQLRTSGIAWNVKGSIATVNDYIDRSNQIRHPDPSLAAPFSFTAYNPTILSSSTVAGTHIKPNSIQSAVLASILGANTSVEALRNGFIRIFNGSTPSVHAANGNIEADQTESGDTPTPLSEEEAFIHFARNYKFTANPTFSSAGGGEPHLPHDSHGTDAHPVDDTFVTLALHNAEVARAARQLEVSQIWLVLVQLLGPGERRKEEAQPTGPPPLPMDEHTPAAKSKSQTDTATSSSASTVLPTTYVLPQASNPSTLLHQRYAASLMGSTTGLVDVKDALDSQYLQIQLVNAVSPSAATSFADARVESKSKEVTTTMPPARQMADPASSTPRPTDLTTNNNNHTRPLDATQTISAINRSQVLLDCMPTIHKSHCYTLQSPLPYAAAPALSAAPTYLSNPYNSGLAILSSSSFQATLLNSFLEYSIERGDVQTCVAVISLLKEFHPAVITAMDDAERERERHAKGAVGHSINDRFKQWYFSYIDLLQRHELYSHASEIIQMCNDDDLGKMNQKSTTIALICPVCKHASQQVGIGCTSKICAKTRMTNCSLCQLPVTGVYVWCQGCGHGGHMSHMQSWFGKHTFCPTGCLHRCVELLTSSQTN